MAELPALHDAQWCRPAEVQYLSSDMSPYHCTQTNVQSDQRLTSSILLSILLHKCIKTPTSSLCFQVHQGTLPLLLFSLTPLNLPGHQTMSQKLLSPLSCYRAAKDSCNTFSWDGFSNRKLELSLRQASFLELGAL
jgi:hypothetical protein